MPRESFLTASAELVFPFVELITTNASSSRARSLGCFFDVSKNRTASRLNSAVNAFCFVIEHLFGVLTPFLVSVKPGLVQIGTETTINSGDMAGILMIAVQALEKRTAELKETKAQIAELAARLEKLESRQKQSIQITAEQRGY